MKYRKKPVVIEARQWDGTAAGATPIINWILAEGDHSARFYEATAFIPDIQPKQPARIHIDDSSIAVWALLPGHWIIRDPHGEFYPCKPDIFAATYEAVDA